MSETCNRFSCGPDVDTTTTPKPLTGPDGVINDDGVDQITDVVVPGKSSLKHVANAQVAAENGNYKKAAGEIGKAIIDAPPAGKGVGKVIGGDGVKEAAKGAVKDQLSPTGIAKGEGAKAVVDKTLGNDDGNTAKMLTPSLDTPSKDKPKSDDDGKSELQKLKDDPLGYLKDLPQRLWDKLRGKDDDDNQSDNQLAKDTPNLDNNGKDPQEKDGQDTSNEKQDGKSEGQDKHQAERKAYQPSDEAKDAYQKALIELNQQHFDTPQAKEQAMMELFGKYRDGKFEPEHSDSTASGDGSITTVIQADPLAGIGSQTFGSFLFQHSTLQAGLKGLPLADPLLIGVSGSGRESIQIVSHQNSNKMMDINGDGIANKISWIAPNNTGLLFFDANKDGKLNGFSELFTEGKLMHHGAISQNGFDYAKSFDTDGNLILDQNDAQFNQLKVLTINEDGNEIVNSLSDWKIAQLNLNKQDILLDQQYIYNLPSPNLVTHESTYIKEDGSTGKLVDVKLSYDTVHTQFTEHIELSVQQANMANLQGFGYLRELNQAATQSEELNQAIEKYSQLTSKEAQLEYLDNLLQEWAKTSPYYTDDKASINAKEFYHYAKQNNIELTSVSYNKLRQMEKDLNDLDSKINRFEKAAFETDATQNKLHILQQFYGQSDNAIYLEKPSDLGDIVDHIDKDYNALKQDMYENLLFQTRLKPYLQEISVNMDENNQKQFDLSGVENKFAQVYQDNPEKALVDLGEFLHYSNMGDIDPNLNQMFAKFYTQVENADELIDTEMAKQIIFPDENNSPENDNREQEINSDEIEILDCKISIDDFAVAKNSIEENPQDFNDEWAYAEYIPNWRYEEQEDKEDDVDWGMI